MIVDVVGLVYNKIGYDKSVVDSWNFILIVFDSWIIFWVLINIFCLVNGSIDRYGSYI